MYCQAHDSGLLAEDRVVLRVPHPVTALVREGGRQVGVGAGGLH